MGIIYIYIYNPLILQQHRRKNGKIHKPVRRPVTPSSESEEDYESECEDSTRAGYDVEAQLLERIRRGQEELEQLKQTKLTVSI